MRKFNQTILLLLLTSIGIISCNKDDEAPKGAYKSGVIIINEGNFQDADGSLSHISASGEVTNNIYNKANEGAILGDVVQSVFVHEDEAYVIVNNSNKVEVINVNTAERIATIEANLPRYMSVANGKGYITEWGSDFATPRVSVVDLKTHKITKKITVGNSAEQIVTVGNKLYVACKGNNTVTVIDSSTDEVSSTIATDKAISGLVITGDGNVWGVHEGTTNWTTTPPTPNYDGAIIRINTSTDLADLSAEFDVNMSSRVATNIAGDEIYFLVGSDVFAVNISTFISTQVVDEEAGVSFYGIGVNPSTGEIYLGDSKSFQGNGSVYIYDADGTKTNTFAVGRGPNGFIFR